VITDSTHAYAFILGHDPSMLDNMERNVQRLFSEPCLNQNAANGQPTITNATTVFKSILTLKCQYFSRATSYLRFNHELLFAFAAQKLEFVDPVFEQVREHPAFGAIELDLGSACTGLVSLQQKDRGVDLLSVYKGTNLPMKLGTNCRCGIAVARNLLDSKAEVLCHAFKPPVVIPSVSASISDLQGFIDKMGQFMDQRIRCFVDTGTGCSRQNRDFVNCVALPTPTIWRVPAKR